MVDRVVNAPAEIALCNSEGLECLLPGVGYYAAAIRECRLRYILDEKVSEECIGLLLDERSRLFESVGELLRFPAEQFWVEWFGMEESGRRRKIGALVEAAPDAQQGAAVGYWEDESGCADTIGAVLEFDLKAQPNQTVRDCHSVAFRHRTLPHVNRLLESTKVRLDPSWEAFFRARGPEAFNLAMRDLAERSWYYLPFLLAFAAMLSGANVVDQRPSNLERLNVARARRDRPQLLDHIEVRMWLDAVPSSADAARGTRGRTPPRLHIVRGHFFRRGGKRYWRSPHLRGDAARPLANKTVLVSKAG